MVLVVNNVSNFKVGCSWTEVLPPMRLFEQLTPRSCYIQLSVLPYSHLVCLDAASCNALLCMSPYAPAPYHCSSFTATALILKGD